MARKRKRTGLTRREGPIRVLRLPLRTPVKEGVPNDLQQDPLPEEITILPYKEGYFKRKLLRII